MLTQFHECPTCGCCIEGTENDTRWHLARQIWGSFEYGDIICSCGETMNCTWWQGEERVWKNI